MTQSLTATATSAGALLSGHTFRIPAYQREYSWRGEQIEDFWEDLSGSVDRDYFLGLIILTENEGGTLDVVDGQQRLLTVTLFAAALHRHAVTEGRLRLATQIESDFLRVLDYDTDETRPRVSMTDPTDDRTLQAILDGTATTTAEAAPTFSTRVVEAFEALLGHLARDVAGEPFKRLGTWADFLSNRLNFAVFVHPDAGAAYRVFEVVNTRGRTLTTADLLKNFVLSRAPSDERQALYDRWQPLADSFGDGGDSLFVNFIRYVATLTGGYVAPKDLYDYMAGLGRYASAGAPMDNDVMLSRLEDCRPLYLQMVDTSEAGPASSEMLELFAAFRELSIVAARPILLALAGLDDAEEGARALLQLMVRRVVAGNLGSGGVERRLGAAAQKIMSERDWRPAVTALADLDTERRDFVHRLARNRYNKGVLAFLRRSVVQATVAPAATGTLHFVRPVRNLWAGWSREEAFFWGTTLGNTFLADVERRPQGANDWEGFEERILPWASPGEWVNQLTQVESWTAPAVESLGLELAKAAAEIWYG